MQYYSNITSKLNTMSLLSHPTCSRDHGSRGRGDDVTMEIDQSEQASINLKDEDDSSVDSALQKLVSITVLYECRAISDSPNLESNTLFEFRR